MTADRNGAIDGNVESSDSPGAILKQAREQAGLSERRVAEQLKLLPQQIALLERNQFAAFNGDIFCKAHIRAYANLLGLDAGSLLEQYRDLVSAADSDPTPNSAVAPVQRPGRGHSLRYWALALVGLVAAALWFYQPRQGNPAVSVNTVVDPNDQSSLQRLDGRATASAAAATPADFEGSNQDPVVIDVPATAPSDGAAQDSGALAQVSQDVLKFEFAKDCWVQVTDGTGNQIYADLKHAQESLVLSGVAPFKVLLGYAHGVSLQYNGNPVEINVDNRNNSARLVVGNIPVR